MANPNTKKGSPLAQRTGGEPYMDHGKRMAKPQSPKGRAWMHRA